MPTGWQPHLPKKVPTLFLGAHRCLRASLALPCAASLKNARSRARCARTTDGIAQRPPPMRAPFTCPATDRLLAAAAQNDVCLGGADAHVHEEEQLAALSCSADGSPLCRLRARLQQPEHVRRGCGRASICVGEPALCDVCRRAMLTCRP
jgi:hypothetical protein